MIGTLAQQLALISYGNQFLKTGVIPEAFYPTNTTCDYCNAIIFTCTKKTFLGLFKSEITVANDPIEWLNVLRNEGCERLEIYYEPSKDQSLAKDRMSAGFVGGGGTWAIVAIYSDRKVYWLNNWMVTDSDAVDRKIWSVRYHCSSRLQHSSGDVVDLNEIKSNLNVVLVSIRGFAARQKLFGWADTFNQSLDVLSSPDPAPLYYTDMLYLPSHSLITRQILFSASIAFVFGGMGSWNDVWFEEDEKTAYDEYGALSETLYRTIINSMVAAINHK